MPRQRLHLPSGILTTLGQKLLLLAGLALVWGGAVVLALAAGVSPADVQTWTGYRSVYDELARFGPARWGDPEAAIVAAAGIVLFVVLLALGWAQRLTPQRARTAVTLTDDELGVVTVHPRTIERTAEIAARAAADVHAVRARLDDDHVEVAVHARRAGELPDTLRDVQRHVADALTTLGVPQKTVRVVVTRFSAPQTRELR